MPTDDFVIARNPEEGSSLPFLIRLPLGRDGIVLKVRETWPRTSKVYCHAASEWPADAEIIERVPVRSCVRRGAAIDLVLDRFQENRSQIVFTRIRGGREAIFWQTSKTAKQARPNVAVPARRSAAGPLTILVDSNERYAWSFSHQQATTVRRRLPAGDYGVEHDGRILAVVERKSLQDLVSTLTTGKLRYALADLASVHRAAVVVEDRYSSVFRLQHVRPSVVVEQLAEVQVRFPTVPVVFADSRALAQEWTYRFLGAAVAHAALLPGAERIEAELPAGTALPPAEPSAAEVRAWAAAMGLPVSAKGRVRPEIKQAYLEARAAGRG